MLRFLKKSYPFNNDIMHNAKVIFFISVVIGAFLFLFRPFNYNELSGRNLLILSTAISLITFSVLSINMIVLPAYIKSIVDIRRWNILKEIIWDLWLFTSVSFGYFLFFRLNPVFDISKNDVLKISLISIFAISILVVLNQNRLVKLNLNLALNLNQKLMAKFNSGQDKVFFESEYKKDSLSLTVDSIRLIKSSGNYIEIYFSENGKIIKHLIRNTLKYAEELLKNYNFIFRCHRTFLVNINFIQKAEGTPQGVKIHLKEIDILIPVSRNYAGKLQELI